MAFECHGKQKLASRHKRKETRVARKKKKNSHCAHLIYKFSLTNVYIRPNAISAQQRYAGKCETLTPITENHDEMAL